MKKLLYTILILMLGNPMLLAIMCGVYAQDNLWSLVGVLIAAVLYFKYAWMPFRVKFSTLDNQCTELMGWNNQEPTVHKYPLNIVEAMEKIDTYEDCPCDVKLLVWTGDSFEVEYVDMECKYGTYYPANGVEFTHYLVLPNEEKLIDVLV